MVSGGPVRLLPAGPLAALVSDVPPGPVAQTRRNMVAHTSVLERAIARTDVLPLRFGTVAPDADAFARCVAANANRFDTALRDIDGRVELGLKASWRSGVVYAEIIAADAELCRLRDRLRSRPASETYYERVELGRRVEAALVGRRALETATILAELAPLAEREAELHTLDDDMILNRAFLVPRDQEAQFDARVQAVAERLRRPDQLPLCRAGAAVQLCPPAGQLADGGGVAMGTLSTLLGLPVSGPLSGLGWIARQIAAAARQQMLDPKRIETALLLLERRLEDGQIDEATFEAEEALLLEELAEIGAMRAAEANGEANS